MAQLLKHQEFTEEEAHHLVERLLSRAVPSYLIREELIERGYSAFAANSLIRQVRTETREERVDNPDDMRSLMISLALFIGLIFIIILLLLLSGT